MPIQPDQTIEQAHSANLCCANTDLQRRRLLAALCIPGLTLATGGTPASTAAATATAAKWHPGHYVFIGDGRIATGHLASQFRGVQRLYAWSDLEPRPGDYSFDTMGQDLQRVSDAGKRLVAQIQYKAFGAGQSRVPAYVQGPDYGGGVYLTARRSWAPVLWNPKVMLRLQALLAAIGRSFDAHPALEAVVLPETAPSFVGGLRDQPAVDHYSLPAYVAALKATMSALRSAFPKTAVIQYANYPLAALGDLVAHMREHGIGLGGPDVYPRPSALSDPITGIYRLYAPLSGIVPLGAAVQGPDYSVAAKRRTAASDRGGDRASVATTADEESPIPVREHLALARDTLKLNYLFWSAYPPQHLARVQQMLSEPDLAGDPAGGLVSTLPTRLFAA